MEPLSVAASVVGFITFLHGIGNFMTKIVTAKKDEEAVIKQYRANIRQMERILSDVQGYRHDLESASPGNQSVDSSELEACLGKCHVKLEKFLGKLQDPHTKRKALLNRLKWPLRQEKHKKILDLVNQYKNSLQIELSYKQGRAIHETTLDAQAKSAEMTSMRQREEILKRLDIVDVNAAFDKAQQMCCPGTGDWFLRSSTFENFKNETDQYLWLHGMPGAGKTILCGSIVAALKHYVEDRSTDALAYFFFSYRANDKQNVYNALSSIAAQLCQHAKLIPTDVIKCLDRNMTRLPTSVLLELIACLCQCFSRAYIVLDALDEIKREERSSLISTLQYIIGLPNTNLLMTSRREDYLSHGFNPLPIQKIAITTSIVDKDIWLYVSQTFSNSAISWGWSTELCAMAPNIVRTLSKGAKGMFRWVDCQIELLKHCKRPCDVESTLSSLPEDLDETYKRILLSVNKSYQVYAARLLAWIIFTPKELPLDILAEAIIFEPATSVLDPSRRFKDVSSIVDICGNLITCTGYYGEQMTLSHYSVKEYLLSERFASNEELVVYSTLIQQGPLYLTDVWIKYWEVAASQSSVDYNNGMFPESSPFLSYCILASIEHARGLKRGTLERQQWITQLAHLVCDNFYLVKDRLENSSRTMLIQCPISFCIVNCFYEGIEVCRSHGFDIQSTYWHWGGPMTPLSLALAMHSYPDLNLAIIFKNGARDILDGPFGVYSPALVSAVRCFRTDLNAINSLLQNGSVIHSPHYPMGSLLPYLDSLYNYGCKSQYSDCLQRLEEKHSRYLAIVPLLQPYISDQPAFDPIFVAANGLTHSFVGEAAEYYAISGNFYSLDNALCLGANLHKPVRETNVVTTLLMSPCPYSQTIWYFSSKWRDMVALALKHGGDINTLDCIIGKGTNDKIVALEYCTALDLIHAFHGLQLGRKQSQLGFKLDLHQSSINQRYLLPIVCVLEDYGAKILPREPVPSGSWRIRDLNYYDAFSLFSTWYSEKMMHYEHDQPSPEITLEHDGLESVSE